MNNKKCILLYANCIPVKGEHKSAIYDLQRRKIIDIPNDLYDFIQLFSTHTLDELYNIGGSENYDVISEYITFLLNEDVVFYIDKSQQELFPVLSMEWDYPSKISNAIIEISEITLLNLSKTLKHCETLGCEQIYFKIQTKNTLSAIQIILDLLATSPVYSIIFEVPLKNSEPINEYEKVAEDNKRVDILYLLTEKIQKTSSKKIILATPDDFISRKEYFFNISIPFFTEAQKHHVYFNRKIFINQQGIIKNAPETKETFGNIHEVSFHELLRIIDSSSFQKYWNVHKGVINECKNCEYRYMCTDDRLPLLGKNEEYYFKTICEIKV